jgi:hypothetical protein
VNKAHYAWDEENYEDEEKEMGMLCFTRRVCRMRVPKGLKLPHDQQNYDGLQEPKLWLSDHLQAVHILGGSRAIAMQKLAATPHRCNTVLVKHATRRFYQKLGRIRKSIHKKFPLNIQATIINRIGQIMYAEKGRSIMFIYTMVEYNKNSAEVVSDERAVDAFASSLRRSDHVEELGRTKPKTVLELMEIANRFADEEDAYHSKRARSPEYNRSSRQRNQRRRSCNEDGRTMRNQVAA